MSEVTWRRHPIYQNYEASSDGRVRHIERKKIRKLTEMWPGYLGFTIGGVGGVKVHKFVCEAFHGLKPRPEMGALHINGFSTDNRPSNLRWGTALDNGRDRTRHRDIEKTIAELHEYGTDWVTPAMPA